ncbi:DUF397 domain-containing protein [Streptomyces sp. NPDC102274]|uniref:DUF397 domain-containing protein n=1 Tax=Streptomyces sp. NPDC102274 TaxID=3366151 RepID=UPI00380B34C9
MTLHRSASLWRKSSYSNSTGGECIEVACLGVATVGVRDSKMPQGPHVVVQLGAWDLFVSALRAPSTRRRLGA